MEIAPYLKLMVEKGGSDMFFSVGARPNVKIEGNTAPIGKSALDHEIMQRRADSILNDEQREVGIDTLSYGEALKNALREAPDLIMIGEIRDAQVMGHAVHFTETGHLCLATLHSTNANQAIERIINFFAEDERPRLLQDLSLQLKAVIAQRLIPGVDGKRAAAVEVMYKTPYIADLIEKGRIGDIKDYMEKSKDDRIQTFDQAVYSLYKAGKITAREALRYADSQHNVRMRIEFEKPGTFGKVQETVLSIYDE